MAPRQQIQQPLRIAGVEIPARWATTALFLFGALLSALGSAAIVMFEPLLVLGAVAAGLFASSILSRPFWGLIIYTLVFMLRPAELHPELAPLRLERIVGVLALVSMFLAQHRLNRRMSVDWSKQTILLFLFLLVTIASVPVAFWRTQAIGSAIEFWKILVFYLLIVHLVTTRMRLRVFVSVYLALIAYIAIEALGNYVSGSAAFAQGIDRAHGETSQAANANQLGTTLASSFPLFFLLGLRKPFRWYHPLLLLGAAILAYTMIVTGSRASLIGFLGGIVFLWWRTRHRIITGLVGLLLLGSAFQFLPEQYQTRYGTILKPNELDGSSQGRVDAWKDGMRMVADSPLLGVGIGCFGAARGEKYTPGLYLESHSLYVQVPAETGLIGSVVFFSFLVVFVRQNRRTAGLLDQDTFSDFEKVLIDALLAGFVVLLLSGIFGHSLMRRTWYIYAGVSLVVGRLVATHATPPGQPPDSRPVSMLGSKTFGG